MPQLQPGIVEIKHGTERHREILDALKGRVEMSRRAMSTRYQQWADNEEQFMAFMPERDNDAIRRSARQSGTPQYTTLDIPYSYATLMTSHTYFTSVFLSRSPVLQYTGRHGEAQNQEMGVEALMSYQVDIGGNLVPLYIWLLDPGKYGVGWIGVYWDVEEITVSQFVEVPRNFLGVPIPGTKKKERVTRTAKGYVGNRLYNVRPADMFTDPRVPVAQFQRGEFVARYVEVGWADFQDKYFSGVYYNRDQIKSGRHLFSTQRDTGSAQNTLPNTAPEAPFMYDVEDSGYVPLYEIYVRLRPSEWKLGNSDRRELWVFTLANDEVIVSAQPVGLLHGKFPFAVLESEIEGYNLFKRSQLEIVKPLTDTLTWLINTHFFNIRKVLNGEFVVDPSRVVMKDVDDPNPGRLVRLKPAAYGADVRTVMHPLQTIDVTQQHIRDAQMIEMMIQRASGVTDNIMGMVNSSGRKTATEVRTSTSFGVNRLKTTAEYFSAMGFGPLATMLLQNTQQLYEEERKIRIVGNLAEWGTDRYTMVRPEDIQGFFDFTAVDGTLPIDRFAQANLWGTLLGQVRNFPQIMMGYDMAKIFAFVAQLAGLKNITQFRINVVPDGTAQAGAAAGNVIPLQPKDMTRAGMTPQQVPNVGSSG